MLTEAIGLIKENSINKSDKVGTSVNKVVNDLKVLDRSNAIDIRDLEKS